MEERMETKGQGGKRRRVVVWVVVLVVALILAGVGVAWGVAAHRGSRLAEARSACAQASDTLRVARNQYDMYHADEAKTAAALTGKDTGDEKVVKTLAAEYDAQVPELVACNTKDAAELDRRTEVIRRDADWYGTHLTALKAATGKVNDATHAKQVKDAKGALDKKLSAARKLLKDSDGRVADTKTRDALSKAIDAAEQAQQQAQQYTAPAAPQYTAPQTATPQPSAPQPQATTPSTPSAPSSGSTSSGSSGGGDGGVYFNPNSGGQGCGPDFCGGTYDGINHNGF